MSPALGQADPALTRQVELILESVEALPTLSPIAARLVSLTADADIDLAQVARLIETDPALATRIIGLTRRADKGLGDRIKTVKQAVVMLGLEAVKASALSVSVYDLINREHDAARRSVDQKLGGEGQERAGAERPMFDRPGFWRYSVAVACAAELIAQKHPRLGVNADEAFMCGLLHGMGKLVLDLVLPKAYARVLALAQRRASDADVLERLVLGLDHHTAGKRVAEHWGLPASVRQSVWLHGRPLEGLPEDEFRPLTVVVTLARALVRGLHLGWPGDFGPPPDVEAAFREAGLTGRATELLPALHQSVADRTRVLGLDDGDGPELLLDALQRANRELCRMHEHLRERARAGESQGRMLAALAEFHESSSRARTLAESCAAVARSASGLFGASFAAVVLRPEGDTQWRFMAFAPDGRVRRSVMLEEPPGRRDGTHALSQLADGTQMSVSLIGLLPWLGDALADLADVRGVKVLPLGSASAARDAGAPAALLLCDRDATDALALPSSVGLCAAASAWGQSLLAAARREGASRMQEQLAEASHRLAQAQQEIAQKQSFERLAEMTAGAAHEMNNPLAVISGRAQLLAQRLEGERDKEAARAMVVAAEQLSGLISALHGLTQSPSPKDKEVSLEEVVRKGVDQARTRTRSSLEIGITLHDAPPRVVMDGGLVSSALAELVANAIEACPQGPVTIGLDIDRLERQLLITVRDAGAGLSPKAKLHAFDPFFSEKPAGRQRGLGLAKARAWARAMEGDITLQSTPGRGTLATLAVGRWSEP